LEDIHSNAIEKYPSKEGDLNIKFVRQIKDNKKEFDNVIKT